MPRVSTHPNVTLRDRGAPRGWYARWTDPATGRRRDVALAPLGITTASARKAWAERLQRRLVDQRARLAGADVALVPLERAVEDYLADARRRLRGSTPGGYARALGHLMAWLGEQGVRWTYEVRPEHLARYRIAAAAKGWRDLATHLRRLRTALRSWAALGLVPELTEDLIRRQRRADVRGAAGEPEALRGEQLVALAAAVRDHDLAGRARRKGSPPAAPLVLGVLLSGCRLYEWLGLRRERLELEHRVIRLRAEDTKTRRPRTIDLGVSPALVRLLEGLPRTGAHVLPGCRSVTSARRTQERVVRAGAPPFTWRLLRHTAASYLTNAPGIWGAASAFRSADQLGHSVTVAQRHYVGLVRGIPAEARTLEASRCFRDLNQRDGVEDLHAERDDAYVASCNLCGRDME